MMAWVASWFPCVKPWPTQLSDLDAEDLQWPSVSADDVEDLQSMMSVLLPVDIVLRDPM